MSLRGLRSRPIRPACAWAIALALASAALLSLSGAATARPTARPLVPLTAVASRLEATRRPTAKAPAVTEQPQESYAVPGTNARFTAAASGHPKPRTQWQILVNHGHRWRDIAGAHGTSFAFKAVVGQNGDEFRAVFKNRHGRATTAAASLSVSASYARPTIQLQPQSATVVANTNASFVSGAAGDPVPSVQWQLSGDGGASWSDVPGASAPTLTLAATSSLNGYEYRAVFTNPLGSAMSTPATLTVSAGEGPAITSQPQGDDIGDGATASFTATASGSPAPSVQWLVSVDHGQTWTEIAGANSTTYSFTASAGQNLGEYEAVFTNAAGTATTAPAILGVGYELTTNWSGYAAVGAGPYTSISASWNVPAVSCGAGANGSASSQWIGIDGAASPTVEQIGTYSDCSSSDTAVYGAWYEMVGDEAVNGGAQVDIIGGQYPVAAGDSMTASVTVNGSDVWTLTIDDTTHPWTAPSTDEFTWSAPAQASAEWIVERPELCGSDGCTLSPLADFGTAAFANADATTGGVGSTIAALDAAPLEMIRSDTDSTLLAAPSGLTGGDGFTDQWYLGS